MGRHGKFSLCRPVGLKGGRMILAAKKKPTVGKSVYYRMAQGKVLAAVITQINEDTVNLVVFSDNEYNKNGYPTFLLQNVEHGKGIGQWDWQPKEGE